VDENELEHGSNGTGMKPEKGGQEQDENKDRTEQALSVQIVRSMKNGRGGKAGGRRGDKALSEPGAREEMRAEHERHEEDASLQDGDSGTMERTTTNIKIAEALRRGRRSGRSRRSWRMHVRERKQHVRGKRSFRSFRNRQRGSRLAKKRTKRVLRNSSIRRRISVNCGHGAKAKSGGALRAGFFPLVKKNVQKGGNPKGHHAG
jgi:hypothetical protein